MNIIIKHIELIKQIDQSVRLQTTGSPEGFACQLGISKAKLYRVIEMMKTLDAPIEYDPTIESFIYAKTVAFIFGFYKEN
ncbi:hypothetical protein [Aquimarina sp. AU119]|uniref:hypothetical protein n=1 Tax=Aquimarina sp. AU119 TaxID=2108528 RepID=UPI000D6999EC|nr:hypothetical protein [Aquimarina sp. AU119]